MIRYLSTAILLFALLSCGSDDTQKFEHAGGSIKVALDNEPSTFLTRSASDYYSAIVLNQMTEGLVGIDPSTLKIVPKIAESWKISDDARTYTFTLRTDVFFHPHELLSGKEERRLKAKDVIASFEAGCRRNAQGSGFPLYSYVFEDNVIGAKAFFEGKAESIEGLETKGNTITLKLIQEDYNFLYKLANVSANILPAKLIASKEDMAAVGTGPFMYHEYVQGDVPKLVMLRNDDYYLKDKKGNSLPYLDSLVFIFQHMKYEQLDLFETKQTDLIIGLPNSRITAMLEGRMQDFNSKPPVFELANNPLLETHFYFFNMNDPRFKDPKVRQAFNYAFNKQTIGREILRNQYYDLGDSTGITPPIGKVLKGYDFDLVKESGYSYDPEKARKLLSEAGYPNGEGFGSVNLRYNIDDVHSAIADEFAQQLSMVLGINVNIDGSTFNQLIEDTELGKGDIFRLAWSADYPSPESFLMNFYGKLVPENVSGRSTINKARYQNEKFDQLYEDARKAHKLSEQMELFSKAEAELMKDPPIIPLWYAGDIQIMYSNVRNFHFNAMNLLDFTKVYKKDWTAKEYQKAHSSQK
jgi:ABC-type oligopeptide transport system substrate-binding subunit